MNLIHCLSHKNLQWNTEFPSVFKGFRIEGSEVYTTTGDYGCVSVQQYQGDQFRIRLYMLQLSETFIFKSLMPCTELQSLISLSGKWKLQPTARNTKYLEKNRLALPGRVPQMLTITAFQRQGMLFELCFSPQLLEEMRDSFPNATRLLHQQSPYSFETAGITAESIYLIQQITHCTFTCSIRSLYFHSRVRDLLFQFLLILEGVAAKPHSNICENDKELIAEMERIITADLSKKITIEQLAGMVLVSPAHLKRIFKSIKGIAPVEYMTMQRMQLALEMLQKGATTKQAAVATGYQRAGFIRKFQKYYGKRPKDI